MPRRRAHSGSSDEDGGRHSRKRRRVAETIDIEDRLESLITRVGEKSTSSLESNLEGLASVLQADLNNYKSKITKILCGCVTSMPEKLTVYTTLVGLLNSRNYNAGGEFVELLVRHLKEAIRSSEFESARVIVRFLADLVNCRVIVAGSLLAMFDNFVEVTLEDNIPQTRSDWYVYTVLSALPWVAHELHQKKEEEFNKLLNSIQNYLGKRQKVHLAALKVWSSDDPHPQEEYLDCLWAQICQLRQSEWEESQIVRPYLAFDSQLCEALQHPLPQVIPPSHNDDLVYPLPWVVFRMFDYTDVPEGPVLPGSHSIERFLIEEQLHNIIHSHHLERKDCAAALLSFPVKNKIPINYMIVEVVFSQLFNLPRPPYIDILYGSLLIELCKLQPGSMPQVLAQATEMLYERVDKMTTTCLDRFVAWFAYHLSNFQMRWSWDDWSEAAAQVDILSPKPFFIKETLIKGMRLSYHQRIVEIVPESFQPLIPLPPKPIYKFEGEGSAQLAGTMAAHRLMQAMRSKCSPDEAVDLLKDLPNPLTDDDVGSEMGSIYNPLKIEVFVQTLLFLGAKSFTHSFAAIAKFHSVLRAFGETQDAQICILKSTYDLWRNNQHMLAVLVDKYLKTQIVGCSAVANWLFSPEMSSDFTCCYVWEIMHSSIKKMNRQVVKLSREVDEAKDVMEAAQRRARDGLDDVDDEAPTEEMIERLEDKLEEAQSEQKNLFLIIFQRFIIILSEHLSQCESRDHNTPWYKWVIERLQQVFLLHHEQVYKYIQTLQSFLFTSDIDPHILLVFQQFCALRA